MVWLGLWPAFGDLWLLDCEVLVLLLYLLGYLFLLWLVWLIGVDGDCLVYLW